jgi:hypothetical protein
MRRNTPAPRIQTETLSVRISLPLFRSIVERAKASRRCLSDYVRLQLEPPQEEVR